MGFYTALSSKHQAFIAEQHLFFVATAPAEPEGRINLSPKGMDTFRVRSPTEVTYLDVVGSGNETAAHCKGGGRITVMFCSFGPDPLILRLYGQCEVVREDHAEWDVLRAELGAERPGERQIFRIRIASVQSSCGYGVPQYRFEAERDRLTQWAEKKGPRWSCRVPGAQEPGQHRRSARLRRVTGTG